MKVMVRQESDDYWNESPSTYYVAFVGEDHCTLIKTVLTCEVKQAAKVSTCKNFKISETIMMKMSTNQDPILGVTELGSCS